MVTTDMYKVALNVPTPNNFTFFPEQQEEFSNEFNQLVRNTSVDWIETQMIMDFFDQISERHEKVLIVDCADFIDNLLKNYLSHSIKDTLTRRDRKQFFEFTGPAGSFDGKLLLLRSTGAIDVELYNSLKALRKSRNTFAHNYKLTCVCDDAVKANLDNIFYSVRNMLGSGFGKICEVDRDFHIIENGDFEDKLKYSIMIMIVMLMIQLTIMPIYLHNGKNKIASFSASRMPEQLSCLLYFILNKMDSDIEIWWIKDANVYS